MNINNPDEWFNGLECTAEKGFEKCKGSVDCIFKACCEKYKKKKKKRCKKCPDR